MAKSVYIADVCKEIFAGGDVPKSALSYEKTAEYNVPIFSNGEKNCGLYGYTNNARVKEPSITVSARGTIGYTAIRTEPFVPVVRLITLTPKSEVIDLDYLFYATQNYKFEGSGTSIPQLTVPMLKKYKFPLPEMSHQKAIAVKFEKLDQLISLRKQQLTKLDELVKSQFVEMFGDPYMNNKHYPLRKGESFFKLSNGKTVPEDKRLSNGVPAYGGNGISWYTNESLFNHDTIVVGRVGFQSGNVHIAKGPLWITDNAMYMSSCDFSQYNLIFLINLMEHIDFTKFQDAGDLKKITQKPFMQYEYICPPLPLQNQFAAFVERVDRQKQTVQQSLEKLELMKKALMQEYFG